MNSGDFILIDNQLKKEGALNADDKNKLIEAYSSLQEKANVHAVVKKANIQPHHGAVVPFVYPVNNKNLSDDDCVGVSLQFVFSDGTHDEPIIVENMPLHFSKGDAIEVYHSRRYTKKAIKKIISGVVG